MIPLLETIRPQACIGAAAVSVLGSHLSGAPFGTSVAGAALAALLIVAACNDARGKAEATMQERMAELTKGLPLPPGMKLPF